MAYATVADVLLYNQLRVLTGSSVPNASSMGGFLEDGQAIIDSALLEKGYQLPVLSPALGGATAAWNFLKSANAAYAFYRMEWAAEMSDKRSEAEDMWQSALKMVKAAQLDIPSDSGEMLPRGSGAGKGSVATPPFFTRDMVL